MASSFAVPPWAEQAVIVIVNIFISFAAGCATEARKFKTINKFSALLPMISQFVMQPLLVSGLGRAFGLNPYVLVGMILCATTPGGNGSNIAEVSRGAPCEPLARTWQALLVEAARGSRASTRAPLTVEHGHTSHLQVIFGGDIELGIFMTFCSTLVSAGAIPLNYELLAVPLISTDEDGRAPVPWVAIGSAAAILIGGSSCGCLVRYLDDKLGRRLEFWSVKIGVVLLIAGVCVAVAQTAPIWYLLDWQTFVCGLLIPPWKFLVTYGAARLLRLSEQVAETAAMEAGEQNIAVALAILSLAFRDSYERNLMLAGLMVYTLFNQACATPIVTFIFWMWGGRRRRRPDEQHGTPTTEQATALEAAVPSVPGSPHTSQASRREASDSCWPHWSSWTENVRAPWASSSPAAAPRGTAVRPTPVSEAEDGQARGVAGNVKPLESTSGSTESFSARRHV